MILYGSKDHVNRNNAKVIIHKLRETLRDSGAPFKVSLVRGEGYRLEMIGKEAA